MNGEVAHPGALGIVGLQAFVFQLVKATQLSADKFTVSEIKAVKHVENAWINREIDFFASLLALFTDIEAARDLRATAVAWKSTDGSSESSSGFLGSSSLDKRSVGGQGGGKSSSSGQFKSRYLQISSADYAGKTEFVAESISRDDFSSAFVFADSGSYCGQTWRANLNGPRLDISSFSGERAYQALGTFGALKFAQRPRQFDKNNNSSDNPSYIAELAHAKLLPFKPLPASSSSRSAKSYQNKRGAAEPSKADKKALVAAKNAQKHRDQKTEEQKELQAMIMAEVSAGTSELNGSLGTLQAELRAQRTELDRQKS